MADGTDTLGQRILRAARMAAAMHMNLVAESHASVKRGQRVVIGGAGPHVAEPDFVADYSTDGVLAADIVGGSRGAGYRPGARLPRFADGGAERGAGE